MQRVEIPQTEPTTTKEEWTKYSVNSVECEKNAIYQTIVDNKFYNQTVIIEKNIIPVLMRNQGLFSGC